MSLYLRRGTTKVYFLPSIASQSAPTQAELTAGTNFTGNISDVNGWSAKTQFIEVPNFGSRYVSKIPGNTTSDDSSLTFYEDTTSNPVRTTLSKDTAGFIVTFPSGATASSSKCDVFPVQVGANTRLYTSGNEAAKIQVDFSITATPTADAVMGS